MIRDAAPSDFARILELNSAWEHVTSPLDLASLRHLHDHSASHRVVQVNGDVAAFLLAIGPGMPYDSPNYRYFDVGVSDFVYIDRVVVAREHQRAGLGDALYDDLTAFAHRHGVARLVCEVDIEPHNAASDTFHARRGFVEVGTQPVAGGSKRVSLREWALGTNAPAVPETPGPTEPASR
ncbi:MAG: GNAT family N-acetyltransferase [Actinobacteria bacterium HGW-Actinobacteria-10]|nr:MAG: GNAT family N-acetyltransferase [Actinobacteria bacterium HGW-Actinobacteria-10]